MQLGQCSRSSSCSGVFVSSPVSLVVGVCRSLVSAHEARLARPTTIRHTAIIALPIDCPTSRLPPRVVCASHHALPHSPSQPVARGVTGGRIVVVEDSRWDAGGPDGSRGRSHDVSADEGPVCPLVHLGPVVIPPVVRVPRVERPTR